MDASKDISTTVKSIFAARRRASAKLLCARSEVVKTSRAFPTPGGVVSSGMAKQGLVGASAVPLAAASRRRHQANAITPAVTAVGITQKGSA